MYEPSHPFLPTDHLSLKSQNSLKAIFLMVVFSAQILLIKFYLLNLVAKILQLLDLHQSLISFVT